MTAIELNGRSAFVTGGGSGIGQAIAKVLAGAGAAVTCADIAEGAAKETVQAVAFAGGTASAAIIDVTDRAAVDDAIDDHARQYGGLDVLCCSAAIINDVRPSTVTDDHIDPVMRVNFMGTLYANQAAVRHMRTRGRGSIVNLVSACLDKPSPGQLPYSASKAAVVEVTRYLALEVAAEGIRVNAVAPGYIDTPIMSRHYLNEDGSIDEARRAAMLERFAGFAPMGRIGVPEDVAWTVLYLASDMSAYVTGQTLRPNGGMAMPR
jgi:NAD(P)-dependent dehydrogenase (short-subunit alcohol dehydrogenase family)